MLNNEVVHSEPDVELVNSSLITGWQINQDQFGSILQAVKIFSSSRHFKIQVGFESFCRPLSWTPPAITPVDHLVHAALTSFYLRLRLLSGLLSCDLFYGDYVSVVGLVWENVTLLRRAVPQKGSLIRVPRSCAFCAIFITNLNFCILKIHYIWMQLKVFSLLYT